MTGATGFIGAQTARRFAEAGYALRLLVRPTSRLDLLAGLEYEKAFGDVLDRPSIEAALHDVDGLIHVAGMTSFRPKDAPRVRQVNVEGTVNTLEAALACGVKKVLHTSSVAAVGISDGPGSVIDETATWNAHDGANFYTLSKRDAEEAAWRIAGRGLDLVCVNPGIVLGPGDIYGSSTVFMLKYVKHQLPAYIDGGSSYVDVRDVAEGHLRAWEKGRPGQRYILSGENLTAAQLVQLCARLSGTRPVRRTPFGLAYVLAALNEWFVAPFSPAAADFNRQTVKVGALYWFVDNAKSVNELGLTYRTMEESARDTLSWALSRGHLKPFTPALTELAKSSGEA